MSGRSLGHFWKVPLSTGRRRSPLEPVEAARGVLAVHRNGRRLFQDAVSLVELGRYPGAAATAVLAHEEFGKANALGMLAFLHREQDLTKFWREMLESHSAKNTNSLAMGWVTGRLKLPEKRDQIGGGLTLTEELVRLRERSTYVDCVRGREAWSMPEVAIGREEAMGCLKVVFATTSKILTPTQVVGRMAETWARALATKAQLTPSEEAELVRARAAEVWAKGRDAAMLAELDLAEARQWNKDVEGRLRECGCW